MKRFSAILLLTLLMIGCANIRSSFNATSDPLFKPEAQSTFAFLPENDIRIQKRLFYDRATPYLSGMGLVMADAEKADYLIRLTVISSIETTVSINLPPSHDSMLRPSINSEQTDEGESTFKFCVYRRSEVEAGNYTSLWEASVKAKQKDFFAHEKEYVTKVFQQLGKSYSGNLIFPVK